ncbi:hypothetical protein [Virgibacillus dokdonensis]|uniref:hypothetical protein n=1 Tax=Virgibacillus dokdonensis TaxID=302167 RepID=UPI0015F29CFF|nr:hypothetical protein [Virgibacillus dokdonensis]
MSILTMVKILLAITVLILFGLTFKNSNNEEDTFKYGRYLIYLLLLETFLLLVFSFY